MFETFRPQVAGKAEFAAHNIGAFDQGDGFVVGDAA
jgi:hypothetical protein